MSILFGAAATALAVTWLVVYFSRATECITTFSDGPSGGSRYDDCYRVGSTLPLVVLGALVAVAVCAAVGTFVRRANRDGRAAASPA